MLVEKMSAHEMSATIEKDSDFLRNAFRNYIKRNNYFKIERRKASKIKDATFCSTFKCKSKQKITYYGVFIFDVGSPESTFCNRGLYTELESSSGKRYLVHFPGQINGIYDSGDNLSRHFISFHAISRYKERSGNKSVETFEDALGNLLVDLYMSNHYVEKQDFNKKRKEKTSIIKLRDGILIGKDTTNNSGGVDVYFETYISYKMLKEGQETAKKGELHPEIELALEFCRQLGFEIMTD